MSAKLGSLRQRLLAGAMACAACVTASSARAQEATAEAKQHVVKRGDTLWDISHAYLGNAFWWPRIYDQNRRIIKNPHWIYPGQRLTIMPGQPGDEPVQELAAPGPDRTTFYPRSGQADASGVAGDERRPSVERGEFLAAPWIGDPAALAPMGRMLDRVKVEGRTDRLTQIAVIQDRLYIRAEGGARPAVGTELLMVRVDRGLAPWGTVIVPTALVSVEQADKDVMTVRIAKQFGPVVRGQQVLAVPAFTPPAAVPVQPVERGIEGDLVAFLTEQPLHTITEMAFVSIGRAQGVRVGDVLEVFAPARAMQADPGVQVPPEKVARLLVVRADDRTATTRVIGMTQSALQPGLKVRLVARVP